MDYKFVGDFAKCPLGAFVNANKKMVWNDAASAGVTSDNDPEGKVYSIVEDDRFPGGRALRQKYPKGEVGTNKKVYYVRYKSPQTIANLEYSFYLEDGFSFMTPNDSKNCVGKIGPQINWGEVGGDNAKRGTRAMWLWNGNGSNYPPNGPKLTPMIQDQASGGQLLQPMVYGPKIIPGQMYKVRSQIRGGPQGMAKFWIDDKLIAEETGNWKATAEDDVIFDFAFWHGGGSQTQNAPEHDSFARCGNVRMWSGEAAWSEGNGGDGGTGEGGDTTPPTPPGGATLPFSLAVGETKIFRARFFDLSISPAQEIAAGANVKWSLTPNNVSWGAQAGPNWSAIKVTGRTAGSCMLMATDPSSGLSTEPIQIGVTEAVGPSKASIGYCTVEPV